MTDRQIHIRKFIHVVSKLVDEGYSVEELARKLEVSTEEVQAELDRYRNFQIDPSMITQYENSNTTMDRIRCAYLKRYFAISTPSTRDKKDKYKDEPTIVQEKIDFIKQQMKESKSLRGKELYFCYKKVTKSIPEIEDYKISLKDCYTLLDLVNSIPTREIFEGRAVYITESRGIIVKHLIYELSQKIAELSSLKELEELERDCSKHTVKNLNYQGIVDAMRKRIRNARSIETRNKIFYDITPQMHKAIHGLIDGSLTPEEAKMIINPPRELVQSDSQPSKSKTRIKRRDNQQVDRTKNLTTIVGKRGDLYPIDNPLSPKVIERFCSFIGGKTKVDAQISYMNMAYRNLCSQDRYKDAKDFLDAIRIRGRDLSDEQQKINSKVKELQGSLARREIGALLLERIRHKISDIDDKETLDMIFKKMDEYKIPEEKRADFFETVKLGSDQLRTSDINLADVFPKERIYGDY